MRMKFDRNACVGMLACVREWDVFEQDDDEFKPILNGGEEISDGVYALDVPEGAEDKAQKCVKVCPVNAIEIIDE